MQHTQEEDFEAREYRLYVSRQLIRFLQSRLLLQPLEELLGTDSDYQIEKAVLGTARRTNRVKKLRRLEVGAGTKLLRRVDFIVSGLAVRYRHPMYEFLREDVDWSITRVWKLFCRLSPASVDTLFEVSDHTPLKPLRRRLQAAHCLRRASEQLSAQDQVALWLGLLRERQVIGDLASVRLLRRQLPAAVAAFRTDFGDTLAGVLQLALNHGPLAYDSAPGYRVLSRDKDKIVLSSCR